MKNKKKIKLGENINPVTLILYILFFLMIGYLIINVPPTPTFKDFETVSENK